VVLVDTSVWVEVFRRPARVVLERDVDLDDVATCLPVVQEVLQGFRDEAALARAREAMQALPTVESPLRAEVFLEAADLYRAARHAGIDCLIAACALRHRFEVLHHDRDYDALARISGLRARRVRLR
jgi:predicted nucleic acid-binding protein